MTLGPETSYRVRGGAPLHGTVFVQGAKNAALPILCASLLTAEPLELTVTPLRAVSAVVGHNILYSLPVTQGAQGRSESLPTTSARAIMR